jgi:hypothetical protein
MAYNAPELKKITLENIECIEPVTDVGEIYIDSDCIPVGESVYIEGTGDYSRLRKLYERAAELCRKTRKNKKIDVTRIKKRLKKAQTKCENQAKYCDKYRLSFETKFTSAKELAKDLENDK